MNNLIRALQKADRVYVRVDGETHRFNSGREAGLFIARHRGRKLSYRYSGFQFGYGSVAAIIR